MKKCITCNLEKSDTEFYKRTNGNLHNQCKGCILLKQKQKRDNMKLAEATCKKCTSCSLSKSLLEFIKISDDHYHDVCNNCVGNTAFLCRGCNQVLPSDCFWVRYDTNKPRGECKSCVTLRRDVWRADNEERYKSQAKEYRNRPEIKLKNSNY